MVAAADLIGTRPSPTMIEDVSRRAGALDDDRPSARRRRRSAAGPRRPTTSRTRGPSAMP
jgi:hypothetical protein